METLAMEKRTRLDSPLLWFDGTRNPELLPRAVQSGYTGVVLGLDGLERFDGVLSDRVSRIVDVGASVCGLSAVHSPANVTIASSHVTVLREYAEKGYSTAYRAHVVDAASLHDAISTGKEHAYVLMSFKDPTNIPLELVIASLQTSKTILVKEIEDEAIDDAIVTLGVMEVGAEGILFTPKDHGTLDGFLERWKKTNEKTIPVATGEVVRTRPIGMGYRSCIDLVTLFAPTEGMIVGSTSQGGILCCPEVFYLPYMELRPFRVNAGAVHSYVYNLNNSTHYMTELRAGSPVMVTDASGRVRQSYVGRMKTEVRPLRLIEAKFEEDRMVNLLLQDDWHVRIYSDDAKPLNITELKPGTKILGHVSEPGRHVGIKVSEHILEN